MGLEYRGERVSDPADIIRLLDAQAVAQEVSNTSDSQAIINSRVSTLAEKSYVDSAFSSKATQSNVDNAFSTKVSSSALGSSLLKLDDTARIPVSALPDLTTRGAVWIEGSNSFATKTGVGDGGTFGYPTILSSAYIYHSQLNYKPFHLLGFAQVEVRPHAPNANPAIFITTSTTSVTNAVATGHGIPGWNDYYHVTAVPTSRHNPTLYNKSMYVYLSALTYNHLADYTNYFPSWGVLAIPAYE